MPCDFRHHKDEGYLHAGGFHLRRRKQRRHRVENPNYRPPSRPMQDNVDGCRRSPSKYRREE